MNPSNFKLIFVHLYFVLLLILRFGVCREIVCIPSERETLLKVKHSLSDTLNRLSSWSVTANSNCCTWAGVVCNNVTAHVVELHLHSVVTRHDYAHMPSMSVELNPCLVDLKYLNYLDLSGNYFRNMSIPSFLGTMSTLTHLILSDAELMGNIPSQIGNLSNLLYLDLGHNSLYLENLDPLLSLSKLEYLDLGYADLSKSFDWLQTLQTLPSLIHLHLPNCLLPNHYNEPSLLNFSSLLTLDMSFHFDQFGDNRIPDDYVLSFVPKWIFGLTKLVSLQLGDNRIQGPIPDGIQNLTLLENLDLSENSFSSSIPHWLYNLHHLKFLILRSNNLRGNISDALGNLTSLVELDLSFNQLEGRIPTSLGNLTSLIKLDLSNNHLEGNIPASLCNLCNLREIHLSCLKLNQQVHDIFEIFAPCISHGLTTLAVESSQLSGNLTDQFGAFENIVELHFSDNSIGGALPNSFGKLSSLRHLDLSKNKFSGNPFEILRPLSKLSNLDISDNLFQGVVKENDLVNLTSLKVFYASKNNLTLEVGPNWLPGFQLSKLDMRSWQLGPNFPSWIQSQGNLDSVQMSNTGIFDSIPSGFWQSFSRRSYINLSHNHIYGELETTLWHPISITIVDLSINHLSGKLPNISSLVIWLDLSSNSFSESMDDFICMNQLALIPSQLQYLNLASNNISGKIPDCWGKWTYLVDVNLQNNHLVGNLPPSMGFLKQLQSLRIRNNSLSGIFPPVLEKNHQLIFLDLGENSLSGTIPAWVGEKLVNMKILCLRSNSFSGPIPIKICRMSHLQVLDLAQNNLSGKLPSCFNDLNAMTLKNKSNTSLIYCETLYSLITSSFNRSIVSGLLWLKGREDEYKNFLGLVASIDLSNNTLSGEIPKEITNLNGLNFLNLSHNRLNGPIPQNIGNMGSLLSIDFSRNQLSGEIPSTMSNLSFLSMLDLSYNHLKGKIPMGTQLQTFDASNFIGNNLCGSPLPTNCSSNGKDHDEEKSERHRVNWFFVSMTFGFIVGFWAVVAPLFIWRSWRYAYFHFLDQVWFKLQSLW